MKVDLSKAQKFYGIALHGRLILGLDECPVVRQTPEWARQAAIARSIPEEARIVPVYYVVEDTPV